MERIFKTKNSRKSNNIRLHCSRLILAFFCEKKDPETYDSSVPRVVPPLQWMGNDKIPTEMIASNKGHSRN